MSKLSLDALKERAGATTSTELLATISGGTENACHDTSSTNGGYSSWGEFYEALGEMFIRTGL